MSMDKSLKSKASLSRHRNVLSRAERIEKLKELERWDDSRSAFGLPKVAHRKAATGGKGKKEAKEAKEAAAAAAGAPAAAPAAEAAKTPAGAKPGGAKPAAGAKPATAAKPAKGK
jgi:small basic protein (TIGR04137 family)